MDSDVMISSIFQTLFGCSHKRLTRPITSVSKPGVPGGETSVVCLDCGKQFAYDWDHMRIGKPIERSHDSGVLPPDMPGAAKTKMKYALIGSAIPFAVLLGSAMARNRRARTPIKPEAAAGPPVANAELDRRIELPHGGPGAGFRVGELIEYIKASGRDYIIGGEVDCALADHPNPGSLDYWLRENFARNKETKQATSKVIAQLVATGLFQQSDDLRWPDRGDKCRGLRLKSRLAPLPAANGKPASH
jgi:hypothetical protein